MGGTSTRVITVDVGHQCMLQTFKPDQNLLLLFYGSMGLVCLACFDVKPHWFICRCCKAQVLGVIQESSFHRYTATMSPRVLGDASRAVTTVLLTGEYISLLYGLSILLHSRWVIASSASISLSSNMILLGTSISPGPNTTLCLCSASSTCRNEHIEDVFLP